MYSLLICWLFTKYFRFLSMVTETFCVLVDFPFALGKSRSSALGALAVNMKNTNNRKTMSVIDAMLNSALTLLRPFSFMVEGYMGSFNRSKNSTALASI